MKVGEVSEGFSPQEEANDRLVNKLDILSSLLEKSLSLGLLGSVNAQRLLELIDASSGPLSHLPDSVLVALEKEVEQPSDQPIIPALRVADDFTTGENIIFRQPEKGSKFLIRTVDGKVQDHIVVQHAASGMISFIDPKYPALYKLEDYKAFKFPDGRQYGRIRQISALLAINSFLDPRADADLLRQLRRHFGVDPKYLS